MNAATAAKGMLWHNNDLIASVILDGISSTFYGIWQENNSILQTA